MLQHSFYNTIYNPFHSIGFFSVFETEAIKSAEVLSGGFSAEYGGRISAIVDLKTREGDKTRFGGLVSASPFQLKGLVEGPITPFNPESKASSSFLITGKHSILDKTSQGLYDYASPDSLGLPYAYTDLYGKVSFLSGDGSKVDFFGFSFSDGSGVAVAVAVGSGVAVSVGSAVAVAVFVAALVAVLVGSAVFVAVAVLVGAAVSVAVAVAVSVGATVFVAVAVSVAVLVGVAVFV